MKIVSNTGVYNPYDKAVKNTVKEKEVKTPAKSSNKDKVEISSNAINQRIKNSEVDYLKDRINIADDREARIAELKAQISAGTYKVSSEDVADAIINSKKV
jgi:flagellar biosynthesis anti-sigma factor FlgM